MQHRDRFIQEKREKDVDYWQAVRILQKDNECVTMHRARTLQKDRTNALECLGNNADITERYKPVRMRHDLQETVRILQGETRQNACVTIRGETVRITEQKNDKNQHVVTTDDVDYR